MKLKIGFAIVCRYNSSRLRGKILKEIDGKPIIEHIINRFNNLLPLSQLVITTSVEATDDVIVDYCTKNGINYFRGSLENVAQRVLEVGEANSWDYTVRINGDNLFIDLDVLDKLLEIANTGTYDFVSNVKGRTYPYGMSIELIKTSFFRKIYETYIKDDERYREHVTLCLYENEELGKYYFQYNTEVPEASGLKLSIDTQDDFDKAVLIMKELKTVGYKYDLKKLVKIFKNEL